MPNKAPRITFKDSPFKASRDFYLEYLDLLPREFGQVAAINEDSHLSLIFDARDESGNFYLWQRSRNYYQALNIGASHLIRQLIVASNAVYGYEYAFNKQLLLHDARELTTEVSEELTAIDALMASGVIEAEAKQRRQRRINAEQALENFSGLPRVRKQIEQSIPDIGFVALAPYVPSALANAKIREHIAGR